MAQDYNAAFRLLYDQFGEDLINMGKKALLKKLQEQHAASESRDTAPMDVEDAVLLEAESDLVADEEELTHKDTKTVYHDADKFEKEFTANIGAQARAVVSSKDVVAALIYVVEMASEVAKFESAQQTVRVGIAAERDMAIAKIEMQKTVLMDYLDRSFDERKENFQRLFTVVDDALEKDNIQQLAMGLDSILKLAETSPFKDLSSIEATTSALNDPTHQWDF